MNLPRHPGVLVLLSALVLAGCSRSPTSSDTVPGSGEAVTVQGSHTALGGSPDRFGPLPDVWLDPTEGFVQGVEDGSITIDMKDSDFVADLPGYFDLVVDRGIGLENLTVRIAVVEDGIVTSSTSSDGGILLDHDGPVVDPGDGSGEPGSSTSGAHEQVRYAAGDWGVSGLGVDGSFGGDASFPQPDHWIPTGGLSPADGTAFLKAKKAFLKAKKAFLKAKKAFVPAIVVFDEARDWFATDDQPVLSGGFGTVDEDGRPEFGGPIVVVGVMPGDNVSVMPGDNVSVMPGDNATSPKVGTMFFAYGPSDD